MLKENGKKERAKSVLKCITIKHNQFCDRLNGLARRLCKGFDSLHGGGGGGGVPHVVVELSVHYDQF